jgi:hypothetical protein
MMTGQGPFGGIEMGGMFTTVKIREGLARNDYRDPGWYRHPKGTTAWEWTGDVPAATRAALPGSETSGVEMKVRKPHSHNHE